MYVQCQIYGYCLVKIYYKEFFQRIDISGIRNDDFCAISGSLSTLESHNKFSVPYSRELRSSSSSPYESSFIYKDNASKYQIMRAKGCSESKKNDLVKRVTEWMF